MGQTGFQPFWWGNEPSAVWDCGRGQNRPTAFCFLRGRSFWRGWRRRGGGLGLWDEPDFLAGRQKRPSVSGPWKAGGAWGLLFRKWVLMVIGFRLKIKNYLLNSSFCPNSQNVPAILACSINSRFLRIRL